MDCIQSIQKAIDYMEANMLENISYEDAAMIHRTVLPRLFTGFTE